MVRKHQSSADESYRDGLTKKAAHLCVENTKIGAYATSHLKSDNEGEPRKNISFVFFVYFFQLLIIEREGLYLSSFCNVSISVIHHISDEYIKKQWEWLESIKKYIFRFLCLFLSADVSSHRMVRDGLTKKAAHLNVENTKIGAYATSHLNSDNEGEPRKNISFVFFVYFFQLLIIEREGLYLSSFCNVSISVIHCENG